MRLLVVLAYAPSLIRVRSYNLLRELGRRHDVDLLIVGTQPSEAELADARTLAETVEVVPSSLLTRGLSCAWAAIRREPLQAAFSYSAAAGARLAELAQTGRYDAVHVEHVRASKLGTWLPPEVPRVLDAVDCISLLWERTIAASHSVRHRAIASLELGPTRRYEAALLSAYDQVAVTAQEDAEALRRLESVTPAAPLTVIPNGVDLEYFRPVGSRDDQPTLIFSGKMSYHANVTAILHFVADVLPRIRASVPDVRLRIIGSEPPPIVQRLADDPRIEVTGYLPDIRPAVSSGTVAVCPVTVKVGIQNKILEAMAMGVPVVASALGARGLAAEPGRDLMVAESDGELAAQVTALLQDGTHRDRVSRAGRAYVERAHCWGASADAFGGLYDAAIAQHLATRPTIGRPTALC